MSDGLLAWLAIGVVAGLLIGRDRGLRVVLDVVAGIAGAFIGGLAARLSSAQGGAIVMLSFLTAFAGALAMIFAMRLAQRQRKG